MSFQHRTYLKRLLAAVVIAPLLAACSSQPAVSEQGESPPAVSNTNEIEDPIRKMRDDISSEIGQFMEIQGIPSVTILAFTGDQILWEESFGYANVGAKVPAGPNTVYNTGSTFKIVIASAIMQLVERGLIELDAPVNDYLTYPIAEFGEASERLTLRHMLAHHAGLPASRPVPDWDIWSRTSPPTIEQQMSNVEAIAAPGTEYDYCNICFLFYADIIENIAGRPLDVYLRNEILVPIGSEYTEPLYPDASMMEQIALPYDQMGGEPVPMPLKFLETWMAGDAYLRPRDLVSFLKTFLNEGKTGDITLLSASSIDMMFQPQFESSVSLGFMSEIDDGKRLLWWDGGIYGGSTVYHLEPETNIGVYIASNSHATTDELHKIASRTRDLLRGDAPHALNFKAPDDLAPLTLSRGELKRFTGEYQLKGANVSVRVDILNDHLALINPANRRYDLVLTSQADGRLVGPGERVTFRLDDSAQPIALSIGENENAIFVKTEKADEAK